MKKMLLVILLAFVSQAAAQTPCSQTERASATSYGALAAPSSTPVSSVLQACENPGEAEEAEPEPSVYDDAIALWKLDETSDGSAPVVRVDSIGSNDLTDNNTVASAAKGVGAPANLPDTVASFVAANSEHFSRANADLTNWPQADFHFAIWVNHIDNGGGEQNFASKSISTGDQREWRIYNVGGQARCYLAASSAGTGEDVTINSGVGTNPTGQWNLLELRRSGTTIGVAVNGGAFTDGTLTGVFNGTAAFVLGARNSGTFGFYSGLLSTAAIWGRVLTPDERTALYNSGDGAPLP